MAVAISQNALAAELPPGCFQTTVGIGTGTFNEQVSGTPTLADGQEIIYPKFVQGEVERISLAVRAACATSTVCGDQELYAALTHSVEQTHPRWRKIMRGLLRIPRRLLVVGIYGATTIGAAALTYFLMGPNAEQGLRIVVSGGTGAGVSLLLGGAASALDKSIRPIVEQWTLWIWDPGDADSWGKIQIALNEKDRLLSSQVYNQFGTALGEHFKEAGKAVRENRLHEAARHYAVAIRHSYYLFGGLHYYHHSIVSDARSWLPRLTELTEQQKMELILLTCRELQNTPPDERRPGYSNGELPKFGFGVMLRWLIVHPSATRREATTVTIGDSAEDQPPPVPVAPFIAR